MAILWERIDERKKQPGRTLPSASEPAPKKPARARAAKPSPARTAQTVDRVLDGQTLVTRSGECLRLARIQAPPVETSPGLAARCWLAAYCTPGIAIAYERKRADEQGRTVAEVYVLGQNISDLMLKQAIVSRSKPAGLTSETGPKGM
jgi:endonuclease YncB( thermonuclease family)